MTWGAYIQQGLNEELDRLGSKLSEELHCPVHYPAYNKHLFECMCGVIFPMYVVRGEDWEIIRKKHDDEKGLIKQ